MTGFRQITPAQDMRLIGTPNASTTFDVGPLEALGSQPRLVSSSCVFSDDAVDPVVCGAYIDRRNLTPQAADVAALFVQASRMLRDALQQLEVHGAFGDSHDLVVCRFE